MQFRFQTLGTACLSLLTLLVLSCDRRAPKKTMAEAPSASASRVVKTLKVLQYNVKEGKPARKGKRAQICCWRYPAIQKVEQDFIVDEMTNQGVELASLIESDNQTSKGVYNCSTLDELLPHVNSLAEHCTLCPYGTFNEALHLVWNTTKWKLILGYDPGDTCFGDSNGAFEGRAFAAALLQNIQDKSEIVFIGVHPGHPSSDPGNQDFKQGAQPIWDAYNQLINGRPNPKLIISGDFNLLCDSAVDQINDSSKQINDSSPRAVHIDKGSQCSNPPMTCCCNHGFPSDFDHVFTNLPSAKVSAIIPASYAGPFTPPGGPNACPNDDSEEHKPVVATITY